MKILEKLIEHVGEELEDSEEYIELALRYKEENPMVAKTFFELSLEEMKHVEMIHGDVADIIEKHRREHGEPPASMLAVYDYLHKKNIDKAAKIKMLQNQYRN